MPTRDVSKQDEESILGASLTDVFFRTDAVSWHDKRCERRWKKLLDAKQANPKVHATECYTNSAELKAYYHTMNNPRFDDITLLPGFRAAALDHASRTNATTILVPCDTTQVSFNASKGVPTRHGLARFTSGSQGFFTHTALALTSEPPFLPLGVLDLHHFVLDSDLDHDAARSFWTERHGLWEKKQERWTSRIFEVEKLLEDSPVEALYVLDREGDSFADMVRYRDRSCRFIIRACHLERKLPKRIGQAFELGELEHELESLGSCQMEVQERTAQHASGTTYRPRAAREARFEIRSSRVRFEAPESCEEAYQGRQLEVWAVWASEVEPPDGEEPMKWVLLTTEEAKTYEQARMLLAQYAGRWKIEELFKCLKSGTNYEERQLESVEGLLKEESLSFAVALTLLAVRDWGRARPKAPASQLLTELELEVLQALTPSAKWSKKATCGEVLFGLARLGGWVKRKDRPPGWIILGRAYIKLQDAVRVWKVARGLPL